MLAGIGALGARLSRGRDCGRGVCAWKALGIIHQGCMLALTGKVSEAVKMITSGASAYRATGSTIFMPWYLPILARAYAELGQFNEAWASIVEALNAIDASDERWGEAEVHRVAG